MRAAQDEQAAQAEDESAETAGVVARVAAVVLDAMILAGIDAAVVYFTLQICGLSFAEIDIMPKVPLIAFLTLQNFSYFVAFTVGGQTLGQMAIGHQGRLERPRSCHRICGGPCSGRWSGWCWPFPRASGC